jgi:hypothetical protein
LAADSVLILNFLDADVAELMVARSNTVKVNIE